MRGWQGLALAAVLMAAGGVADAEEPADGIVRQLREQGYVEFSVDRTWLGRVQVIALAPDVTQREIVFSPSTGEILRDYVEADDGGSAAPRIMDRPAGGSARPAGVSSAPDDGQDARQGNGRGQDQAGGNRGGNGNGNGRDQGNGGGQDQDQDQDQGQGQGQGQGNGKDQGNGGQGNGSDRTNSGGQGQGNGRGQGNGNSHGGGPPKGSGNDG